MFVNVLIWRGEGERHAASLPWLSSSNFENAGELKKKKEEDSIKIAGVGGRHLLETDRHSSTTHLYEENDRTTEDGEKERTKQKTTKRLRNERSGEMVRGTIQVKSK